MDEPRSTPFHHLFGEFLTERFPTLRVSLAEAEVDPRDRDAFLLAQSTVELLHAIRPEEGLGDAIDPFVALVHAAYLYWIDGTHDYTLDEDGLRVALSSAASPPWEGGLATYYLRLPPQRVWGTPVEGRPAEPMDGAFILPRSERIHAVAVFGFHPGRRGITVVEVEGSVPTDLARLDGTPLFDSTLPGGHDAGLFGVTGMEELLALIWRVHNTRTKVLGAEP